MKEISKFFLVLLVPNVWFRGLLLKIASCVIHLLISHLWGHEVCIVWIPTLLLSILRSSWCEWKAGSWVLQQKIFLAPERFQCFLHSSSTNKWWHLFSINICLFYGGAVNSFCMTTIIVRSCGCYLGSHRMQFRLTKGSTTGVHQLPRVRLWMLSWHTSIGTLPLDLDR